MQKAADAADMSVLFFSAGANFGKATHKTMQALVLAALLESSVSTSATNASTISISAVSTGAISTSAITTSAVREMEMSRLVAWSHTDTHVNIVLEFCEV